MNKFKKLWSTLRSSFWFMPSLIVMVSIAFAVVLIDAESIGSDRWLARWPRLFGAGAQGARDMMSTIAGSMMTVVGVTFSMILVVLALASSQYTSRILRNFMSSRVTQIVLGIFAGIFTYCLIVLRTIRGGNEGAFVPYLAVFFGFVLALGGVGALMYSSFIISLLQSRLPASSPRSLKKPWQPLTGFFRKDWEQEPDKDDDDQTPRPPNGRNWRGVPAKESGYIQSVNNAGLLRLAQDKKTVVRMEHGIGAFVIHHRRWYHYAWKSAPVAMDMARPEAEGQTDCATARLNTLKWAPVLPSGAR